MMVRSFTGRFLALKNFVMMSVASKPVAAIFSIFNSIRSPLSPSIVIFLPKGSVTLETAPAVFFGFYEAAELRAIKHQMPQDIPMIEIGGGVGVVSSHVIRRLKTGPYKVIEANSQIIDVISTNLSRNNSNGIAYEVIHGALDYSGRKLVNLTRSASHLETRVQEGFDFESDIDSAPAFSLSTLVNGWKTFGLIADIEGAESNFILGQDSSFDRCKWLCIELHDTHFKGRAVSIEDLVTGIQAKGFVVIYRDGAVVTAHRPYSMTSLNNSKID